MVSHELIASIIIAIVQGITEWLPISSSGHLAIAERLLNYKADLMFDVALHFGTLMAAFVYFGGDIVDIIKELLGGRWRSDKGRLGILLILATIPAVIFGFLFKDAVESAFSNFGIIALGFGVTGLFLLITGFSAPRKGIRSEKMSYKNSLVVGFAQAIALLPGVSRSGSTITSGILTGLDPKEAAKFSFLLSIPVVFGANILTIGNNHLPPHLIWATLTSFVVGLITLHLFFRYVFVSRRNLRLFGAYALVIAFLLVIWNFIL